MIWGYLGYIPGVLRSLAFPSPKACVPEYDYAGAIRQPSRTQQAKKPFFGKSPAAKPYEDGNVRRMLQTRIAVVLERYLYSKLQYSERSSVVALSSSTPVSNHRNRRKLHGHH